MKIALSTHCFLLTTLGIWIAASANAAEPPKTVADWPQWRGPTRDGQAPKWKLPEDWRAPPVQVWKVSVGLGHSSPVIVKNRIYQFSRRGEDVTLACFDLAGKELWSK